MKISKIVCILLAVLLLAGCVGCVSAASIETVSVTVTAPETDKTPGNAQAANTGFTVTKTTWSPTVDGTFNAGQAYTVTVTVKANTGNTFADSVTAKVNSNKNGVTFTPNEAKTTATITYTFTATAAATKISEIKITNLDSPKPAASPDKTITITTDETSSALKTPSVSWSPTDSTFLLDKEYTVTIELQPSSKKYVFDSTVTAKIGDITLTSSEIKQKDGKLILTHTYPKTEPLGKISIIDVKVNAPSVGKSPSSSATTISNMFTANAVWSPSETFKPDTSYTVTVSVNAKYGYLMDTTLTAKVNGAETYVERISDTQAKVTYTFGQIASVDWVDVGFTAPASGAVAQTSTSSITASSGTTNSATIKWTPQLTPAGEFDSGVEYMAEVTFSIAGNVAFDKSTIVKINGNPATVQSISTDGKTIKATYTFPKTTFIPNPIEVIKEFFKLMLLLVNPASYAF